MYVSKWQHAAQAIESHASWWSLLNANAGRHSPQLEHCCRLPRLLSFCTSGGYRTGHPWAKRLLILISFFFVLVIVIDTTRTCLRVCTMCHLARTHAHARARVRAHTHTTWALYLSKVACRASTYLACLVWYGEQCILAYKYDLGSFQMRALSYLG
jgi:hypothetical protein